MFKNFFIAALIIATGLAGGFWLAINLPLPVAGILLLTSLALLLGLRLAH